MQRIAQGKDFQVILMVKMENRHPVEGPFESECPAICNHCGVMTAWSRKTRKFWAIFAFLEKRPLIVKFSKILFQMFSPIDVVVLKCRKIFRMGNRRNRTLFTRQKKIYFGFFSNCHYYCHKRLKPRLVAFYDLRPGNGTGLFWKE